MKWLKMERILSRIEYVANENPTCNILINGKKQCEFTGDSDYFEFPFQKIRFSKYCNGIEVTN